MRYAKYGSAEKIPNVTLLKILGHSDNGQTLRNHYHSKLPHVDIQGLLLHGKQDNIDWNQYMRPAKIYRALPTTQKTSTSDMPASLMRSSELFGDLRLEETVDRIVTARFLPDSSIIHAALDTPDFDLRTNGRAALKALIRILRSTTLDGKKMHSLFYPDEFPQFIDGQSNKAVCPECLSSLDV
jgi:hypothetical protein